VKRAFKFRFHPDPEQADLLNRTFGCVRKVYNLALQAHTEGWYQRRERINYNATSAMLTAWKKSEELAFLNEVSSVPLQQCLRHLQGAFSTFRDKRTRYPCFESKHKSRASAEFTPSAFRFTDGELTLAKMTRPSDIVWSRPLPEGPIAGSGPPAAAPAAAVAAVLDLSPAPTARCSVRTSPAYGWRRPTPTGAGKTAVSSAPTAANRVHC
jgi:transposase